MADSVAVGAGGLLEHRQRKRGFGVASAGLLDTQGLGKGQIEQLVFREKPGQSGMQLRIAREALRRRAEDLLDLLYIFHCHIDADQHREWHHIIRENRIGGFESLAGRG